MSIHRQSGPAISTRTRRSGWTLYAVKPRFVALLTPIRDRLVAARIHPDALTVSAVPVQLAIAAGLIAGTRVGALWIVVPPLVLLLMALNALDGSLARATGSASAQGALLNELADRAGDLVILCAGFVIAPFWIAVAAFAAVAAAELIAAMGWAVTGERRFDGPGGKPDRAALIAAGAGIAVFWPPALPLSLLAIAVSAGSGALMRAREALERCRAIDRGYQ